MSALSDDQVRHIAKLARLELDEKDVSRFAKELSSILDFVEQLQEVDTEGVEPLTQVTKQEHVLRDDEITEPMATSDELLATSPLPITDKQIQTLSAH